MIQAARALILRDIRLFWRGGGAGLTLSFFVLAALIIPFGIGPDKDVLLRIGPGVMWVSLVFAMLISLEHIFQADYEDGSFDLLMLSSLPPSMIGICKALTHWLTCALPLIAACPLAALFYGLGTDALFSLMRAMAAGTPALSLIGTIAAALCVSVRRGGLLIALLLLPLFIPVLIFGVIAADPQSPSAHAALLFLCAFSLGSAALAPYVVAGALKLHLD